MHWTTADTVLSVSADGVIKQWDSISGQVSRSRPPHTLGIVSLSVDPTGKLALYNTLEGLTSLWDLDDGEVKGSFESYARAAGAEATEPCTSLACLHAYIHPHNHRSLPQPHISPPPHETRIRYRPLWLLPRVAWSVSLNPRGGTYASTGGSGNVTIHSADTGSFGERRATLTSGRNKFGMHCEYVGHSRT